MEALAAVGLAANVLQFVQFGCDLFSLSTEIVKSADGQITRHKDLELIAKDLRTHIKALRTQCGSYRSNILANESLSAAQELLCGIEKIREKGNKSGSKKKSKWRSLRQALEVIWKKDKIANLMSRLESLRDQLQFHFVTEIRHSQDEIGRTLHNLASDNATTTATLSSELGVMLNRLDSIGSQVSNASSLASVSDVRNIFDKFYHEVQEMAKIRMILSSLQYPTMSVRHTAISEAHQRTFEWIFETENLPTEDPRSRINFSTWLRDGRGLFWITGKPGSGKSTLMKFLEKHNTTLDLLHQWSHPSRMVLASFYFWNAGTHMQKSLEGLLQSLLYETLSNCPSLISVVCRTRWSSAPEFLTDAWSLPELQEAFQILKKQQQIPIKFYFHIDGLDEYDGDHYRIIQVIDEIAQLPTFKICVSSRPWNQFQHTIGQSNNGSLQLHLFTRSDIELFARESIWSHRSGLVKRLEKKLYDEIIHEIRDRAQGVFLWVRLVVHSLRDGIVNDDPISLLRKRLEELPTDLEEFFELILRSVDSVYGERMARTFLTAIASPRPLSTIQYSFLDEEDPYFGWTSTFQPLDEASCIERISATLWRLNGRYKGLLEPSSRCIGSLESLSNLDTGQITVDFLHRTLKDFLETTRMKKFLESRTARDFDPLKAAMGALLAEAKFVNPSLNHRYFVTALQFAEEVTETIDDRSLEFSVVDHVESICPLIHPTNTGPLVPPDYMLRIAVHYQHDDYVKRRINTDDLPADLDWILLHLSSYPRLRQSAFSTAFKKSWSNSHECECRLMQDFDGRRPRTDLVQEVLKKGANPRAKHGEIQIWQQFLVTLERNVYSTVADAYWKILKLMVTHGVIIDGRDDLWTRLARSADIHKPTSIRGLLNGLMYLLDHGLDPDMDILLMLLSRLHATNLSAELRVDFRNLISAFLRHGADIGRMKVVSFPYGDQPRTWLRRFLDDTATGLIRFCGLESFVLFEVFLQYGLQPNTAFEGSTLWEHILNAMYHQRIHPDHVKLILLFLQYQSNPNLEVLHRMLGWTPGDTCRIPEPDPRSKQLYVEK